MQRSRGSAIEFQLYISFVARQISLPIISLDLYFKVACKYLTGYIKDTSLQGHRLGYRFGQIVSLIYVIVGGLAPLVELSLYIVRALALVRPCLGLFPFVHTFLFFQTFYYSLAVILLSIYSSCLTLAVPIREVSCVDHKYIMIKLKIPLKLSYILAIISIIFPIHFS